jgi:hypothetical protein
MQLGRPIQTRFRCASTYRLKLAAYSKSLTHYTKGTPSPRKEAPTACRHPVSGTVSLPLSGCFSPFPHGTGALSVTEEYLGLEGGPPMFRQDFTCPALLEHSVRFTHTGLSPTVVRLSRRFRLCRHNDWPGPRSLATTSGVSVDVLSSGYLDVSVRRVRLPHLWIQCGIPLARWVAPFGDSRIKACSRLPVTFRNVLRPSSPLSAKASTRCPSDA